MNYELGITRMHRYVSRCHGNGLLNRYLNASGYFFKTIETIHELH